MAGLWQPDPARKTLKLSAGGARFAAFAYDSVKQTKGRWGTGYDIHGDWGGPYGAPLALESWQLQSCSEGLRTKPTKWLTVDLTLPAAELYTQIKEWVRYGDLGARSGPRIYREWYLQMPKKVGKAVDIEHKVPTPQGWKRFGDLRVGDHVFDEHGKPTRVRAVSPIWLGRPCYRMKLTDGAEIITDRDHEWVTEDPAGRRHRGRHQGVVETREIAETLKHGYASNHAITYPGALEFDSRNELPVAPYTLGAWLGDGATDSANLTSIDMEIVDRVRADGYEINHIAAKQRWGIKGLLGGLRSAGVLGRKHIPEIYKRASVADRLELLRGLMDTDGSIRGTNNYAELALSDGTLAADALELIRSLGFAPRVTVNEAKLNGVRKKDRTRIKFRCWADAPNPFHLSRKANRVSLTPPTRRERSRRRHVISCKPCESVPVRCIEVENPTGLFLIGETLLITHNSTLSSGLGIYFTGYDGEPGAEVYALASSKGQARTVFEQARQMIFKSPYLMDEFQVYKDIIEHKPSASIFRVLAADADYNEGFNPHAVIIDELHVHKDRELYDAMTSHLHTGAREDPIAITITNAGDDQDSICYELYAQAKAVIDGHKDARTDLYAYVPELEDNEIYNKKKWHKVMPSSWQSVELMEEARKKHPEYVFQRRYLNVWTDAQEGWLPYDFWEAGEIDGKLRVHGDDGEWEGPDDAEVFQLGKGLSVVPCGMPPAGVPIVIGGDLGMSKDTTALAWAGVDPLCECDAGTEVFDVDLHDAECPFGIIYIGTHIWGIKQRHKAHNPPCHTLLDGDRFPMKLLRYYIVDHLRPNYEILEFAYDPWGMEQLAQELGDEGLVCARFDQTDPRMVPASEDLWNAIARDDLLRHAPDPILTKHVMAGIVDETGRGWRINKKKTKKPCDGLIAMLMAVHRALYYHRKGAASLTVL